MACIILEVHDEEVGPAGDEEGDQLTLFDRRVMALSLLNGLPVVALSRTVPTALHHASAASGHTWPVYFIPNPEDAGAMCKVGVRWGRNMGCWYPAPVAQSGKH